MLKLKKNFWGEWTREEFLTELEHFLKRHGGFEQIVERMESLGMGSLAHAWVDTGAFEPIFSEQLHRLFGTGVLRAWAAKLNLLPRDLVRRLSHTMPRAMQRLAAAQIRSRAALPPLGAVRKWSSVHGR